MTVAFDRYSPEFHADPYPYYHRLRAEDPVHFLADVGVWLLSRYDDVVAALRDERLSADRFHLTLPEMQSSALISSFSTMMLLKDPPDHTRLRMLVSKAFTPRVVEGLRPSVEKIAADLLEAVAPTGRTELIADLAAPLPVIVIAQLLGVPAADRESFKRWSDDLMLVADGSLAMAGFPKAEQSAGELAEYLQHVFAERRAEPRDDLISGLLAAREQGDQLSARELFSTCVLLLIAGHETTTNLIGNGMLALLRNPDQLERLRKDPSLIRTAVEELLRFESPVQSTSRVAKQDLELRGARILAGQEVNLLLGAANRDSEQFAAPDRLDVARADNDHVAFGHGLHFCLGAALARLEGQIAIQAVLRRLPDLRLESDVPEWKEGLMMRSLRSLPLTFSALMARESADGLR